jgi:ELWxxDGT repeat protein
MRIMWSLYAGSVWSRRRFSVALVVTVAMLVAGTAEAKPVLYFSADDGSRGEELWRSNGTARATHRVKDILPGRKGSEPTELVDIGGRLYFVAVNEAWDMDPDRQLWRSDGTAAGTWKLPGAGCTSAEGVLESWPSTPVELSGFIFFTGCDGTFEESGPFHDWSREVWRSNGTRAGTRVLKQVNPSGTALPTDPLVANGRLFFGAWDGVHGHEPWISDGTRAGTAMIEDLHIDDNDPWDSLWGSEVSPFAVVNGAVLLAVEGSLWRSDGTQAGTYRLKVINAGQGDAFSGLHASTGGVVYFGANDGVHGEELWRTDGTDVGTYVVKDINPTGSSRPGSNRPRPRSPWPGSHEDPYSVIVLNGILYFSATDGTSGLELWRTDGTAAGTLRVKNINTTPREEDPSRDRPSNIQSLTRFEGKLFFSADDGLSGAELWQSDGTEAGTRRVKDVMRGESSSLPASLTVFRRWIFFRAATTRKGVELWRTDGSGDGTRLVKDIRVGARSSSPAYLEVAR